MASRKRSLTALPFNCGPQQTDNIIVIKDNSRAANLATKGDFGLAFDWGRHGTTDTNNEPRGVELPFAPLL